jgi:hypothetical protein
MALLPAGGDFVVGALDRATGIAQAELAAERITGNGWCIAVKLVLKPGNRSSVVEIVRGDSS